jgi:hypothetical protein
MPSTKAQVRTPTATFSEEQLRAFLGFLMDPSVGCVEFRAFKADFDRGRMIVKGERFSKTISGWYDDARALVIDAKSLRGISGYLTVNPVQADLLARSYNGASVVKHATLDTQIACLRWLYIDIDPVRPADISSTDAEFWPSTPSSSRPPSGVVRATVLGSWCACPTIRPTNSTLTWRCKP